VESRQSKRRTVLEGKVTRASRPISAKISIEEN
jgi:hypothetical protein